MQRQRRRNRSASKENVQLKKFGASVVTRRSATGVTDAHRNAEHVRDSIVAAENGDEAPKAERTRETVGTDRILRLHVLRLCMAQYGGAAFILAHVERARDTDCHDQYRNRPKQDVACL